MCVYIDDVLLVGMGGCEGVCVRVCVFNPNFFFFWGG
jgi:hypothetical protein